MGCGASGVSGGYEGGGEVVADYAGAEVGGRETLDSRETWSRGGYRTVGAVG